MRKKNRKTYSSNFVNFIVVKIVFQQYDFFSSLLKVSMVYASADLNWDGALNLDKAKSFTVVNNSITAFQAQRKSVCDFLVFLVKRSHSVSIAEVSFFEIFYRDKEVGVKM